MNKHMLFHIKSIDYKIEFYLLKLKLASRHGSITRKKVMIKLTITQWKKVIIKLTITFFRK